MTNDRIQRDSMGEVRLRLGISENDLEAICREDVTDADLAYLKSLPRLRKLSLCQCIGVTAKGIEHLADLTALEELDLRTHTLYLIGTGLKSPLTDATIKHLAKLTKLKKLNLSETAVTGAGLAALKNMTELETLTLHQCNNLESGFKHLYHLPRLKELDVLGSPVSDVGVEEIAQLPALEALWLRYCDLSHQFRTNKSKS